MNIIELLTTTVEEKASDLHITVGLPPMIRVNGKLEKMEFPPLKAKDTNGLTKEILSQEQLKELQEKGQLDISFSYGGLGRFRINSFMQRGTYSIVARVVGSIIPTIQSLGLPLILEDLSRKQRGLILVTGPTGSGKSTTLASMIHGINAERQCHILTLEDPIEYLHKHNKSIVNQREIKSDCVDFASGLKAALRQDPDVILVGEMRDLETISTAITAAETGHLVLSTLHTLGAAKTIDRIIDVFPPHQQQQIRVQLSSVLEGVISQQLLPISGNIGRVAALEILIATPAIRNLIREGKTHQIQTSIQTGSRFGMQTMDASIINLYNKQLISRATAIEHAIDKEMIERFLKM